MTDEQANGTDQLEGVLGDGAETFDETELVETFIHGALLVKVTEGGSVVTDMICGYNRAPTQEHAASGFRAMAGKAFPGVTIIKIDSARVMSIDEEAAVRAVSQQEEASGS